MILRQVAETGRNHYKPYRHYRHYRYYRYYRYYRLYTIGYNICGCGAIWGWIVCGAGLSCGATDDEAGFYDAFFYVVDGVLAL